MQTTPSTALDTLVLVFQTLGWKFERKQTRPGESGTTTPAPARTGLAKASFVIGMLNWKCFVVCLDRLVLRGIHALGTRQVTDKQYKTMKNQWITLASDYEVKPFVAMEIWWNKLQGFKSPRYWSKILE